MHIRNEFSFLVAGALTLVVQFEESALVLRQLGAIGNVVDLSLNRYHLAILFGQLQASGLQALLLLVELTLCVTLVTVGRDLLCGSVDRL